MSKVTAFFDKICSKLPFTGDKEKRAEKRQEKRTAKEEAKREKQNREHFTPTTIIMLVVLIVYTLTIILLLLWSLMTAFKNQSDFRLNIIGLPKEWIWNFSFVFNKFTVAIQTETGERLVGMGEMYLNSILYSVGCAFFATFVPCITSYMCARFPYKFSKVVHTTVIITMILPIVGALPAEINMAKTFGLYDHVWGLWIMKANFLGMYFLVFYGIFKSMPMAYTEAAKIDGAGNLTILFRIILPLVKTTFFTVMLINFITFWNDYQTPLIFMPSHPTVALGMYYMSKTVDNALSTVPMRMTGAMMLLIPILVVFLLTHKRLLGNLTMGGIKG